MTDQARAFSVRPAEACEMRACRLLLPDTFAPQHAPEAFVALSADSRLIGVATVGWAAIGDVAAFPVAVHVVTVWRRRGVGRALLDLVAATVRGDAAGLQPWTAVAEGGEAAAFFLACDFAIHHRVLHFAGEVARAAAAFAPHRAWLEKTGRIPSNARIVPLSEAPAAEVAHLMAREFGSSPAAALARLRGEVGTPFAPERSVVLLVNGAVMGAQMWSIAVDGTPEVDVNVISPHLRRGWANVLLTHEGFRVGQAKGTQAFRFYCHEDVVDTVNIARRSGAQRVRTDLVLVRAVAAD
jgi:GNAT superfamily N-acetyltransferase